MNKGFPGRKTALKTCFSKDGERAIMGLGLFVIALIVRDVWS